MVIAFTKIEPYQFKMSRCASSSASTDQRTSYHDNSHFSIYIGFCTKKKKTLPGIITRSKSIAPGVQVAIAAANNRSSRKVNIATSVIAHKREASPGITPDAKSVCTDNSMSDEVPKLPNFHGKDV